MTLKGHKPGCKCVGCSPETRRKGRFMLPPKRPKPSNSDVERDLISQGWEEYTYRFVSAEKAKEAAERLKTREVNYKFIPVGKKIFMKKFLFNPKRKSRYSRKALKFIKRRLKTFARGKMRSGIKAALVGSSKQALAIALSEARRKGLKVPVYNPPREVEIYKKFLPFVIYAVKGKRSKYAGQKFRHKFHSGGRILGLPDGSIKLQPARGKRLWKLIAQN